MRIQLIIPTIVLFITVLAQDPAISLVKYFPFSGKTNKVKLNNPNKLDSTGRYPKENYLTKIPSGV